jgi:hypothetical protein
MAVGEATADGFIEIYWLYKNEYFIHCAQMPIEIQDRS